MLKRKEQGNEKDHHKYFNWLVKKEKIPQNPSKSHKIGGDLIP